MADTYYVQVQAKRRRAEMIPVPDEFRVHPDLLMGLEEEAFARGFRELHAILGRLYEEMRAVPDEFGLPLYEIAAYRPVGKEMRGSDASAYRMPNLFACLGRAGTVTPDGLEVDREEFTRLTKAMRVRGLAPLVNRLCEAGFTFSHWSGKAFDRKAERFLAGYSPVPAVMPVLKVAAVRAMEGYQGPKEHVSGHLRTMDYKLFAEPGAPVRYDVSDFCHLIGPAATPFFDAYHRFMTEKGYGYALDDDFYRFQYLDSRGKPTLDYFRCADYRYGDKEGLTLLRLKLNCVDRYNDHVEDCPEQIKQGFRDAWRCQHCTERCNRRVTYRIDGEMRESCICDAFAFFSPRLEDLPIYQALFELEQSARSARGK